MFDTIKLKITNLVFEITDHPQFGTTEEIFDSTVVPFMIWEHKENRNKRRQEYMPKLKIIQKGTNYFLTVKFSAPKLLFGDNDVELTYKDFKKLTRALKKVLRNMGIKINLKYLENAELIELHPSKNLLLEQKYESIEILRELKKVPVNLHRHDIDIKQHRNGGETLQFYNKEFAVAFYDKTSELQKSIAKLADKDKVELPPEAINQKMLRYEVRLMNKKKINQTLAKISDKRNIRLKDVFNSDICQRVLIYYWNDLFGSKCGIYHTNPDPLAELDAIHRQIGSIKIKELIFNLGLKYLLSNPDGFMGTIKCLSGKYQPSSIKAIKPNIGLLQSGLPNPHSQFMVDIEKELAAFKPIKKVKYYYGYEEQNNK